MTDLTTQGLIINCIPGTYVRVKGPYDLNFRTGPGTQHQDLADLHPDTMLQVLAESADGKWLKARAEGWVHRDWVIEIE